MSWVVPSFLLMIGLLFLAVGRIIEWRYARLSPEQKQRLRDGKTLVKKCQ